MTENLGKAVLTLSTDSKKFDKGMASAEARTAKLKKAFKIGALAALGVGVAFAKLAKNAINAADNFAKMSKKVGISVESLSGLEFAAKLSGTTLDALRTSLNRLAANASDASLGVGEAKEAFDAMKIETLDATGALKPMETLLLEVADKFALMEDGTEKTALAMDIFGKSGTDLIPMLNAGSAGIQEMKDRAEELGIVISTKTAVQSERFNDALLELSSAFQGIIFAILDSGLLGIIVDLAETMAAASGNSSIFTTAGNLLAAGFRFIQIAALGVQLAFNQYILTILKVIQKTNQLLGVLSPFKSMTDNLTSSIDQYNLSIDQGREKIDKIREGTTKLTEEVKKATVVTKKQTKSLGALAKAAKKAADKEKKLTDKLKDYIKKAKAAITPTGDVTKHYGFLKDAGFDLKEIMIVLGDEIDTVTTAFDELGKELPEEIQHLKDLKDSLSPITQLMKDSVVEIDFSTASIIGLTSATRSAIDAEDAHDAALKRLADKDGGPAKFRAKMDELADSIDKTKGDSEGGLVGLGNEFSSFLGGIDPKIVPGIGKIKTVFDSVMGTVNSFKSTLDSIIGLFSEGGAFAGVLGGLNQFADLFGSKEGGGGIGGIFSGLGGGGGEGGGGGGLTSSFTELAITGVAIQTGIFGTGVAITGVTIQKGEFKTGVSFTGLSLGFGGGGSDKEVAFNTRLTLGWIKDFFPITTQQLATGHGLLSGILTHTGWIIDTLNAVNSDLGSRLDTLIGIQGNRIAPSVESIVSRDFNINITVQAPVTVNSAPGSSSRQMGQQAGSELGTEFVGTFKKALKGNTGGLRTAIQRIQNA